MPVTLLADWEAKLRAIRRVIDGTTAPLVELASRERIRFFGFTVADNEAANAIDVTAPTVAGGGGFVDGGNSFGATATIGTNDAYGLALETSGSERVRVDASGFVGFATTSPAARLHAVGDAILDNTAASAAGAALSFRKIRTAAVVQNGDVLGSLDFSGYDGAAYRVAARLTGTVGAAPGSGDMPGALRFWTSPDGSTTLAERLTVLPSGFVGIGNIAPAAVLHVDSNAANTVAILTLENTAGDVQLFRVDATPEASVTGSIGDVAIDSTGGVLYLKRSGSATNTGWSPINARRTYEAQIYPEIPAGTSTGRIKFARVDAAMTAAGIAYYVTSASPITPSDTDYFTFNIWKHPEDDPLGGDTLVAHVNSSVSIGDFSAGFGDGTQATFVIDDGDLEEGDILMWELVPTGAGKILRPGFLAIV